MAPSSGSFYKLDNPLMLGIKNSDRGRISTVYPAPKDLMALPQINKSDHYFIDLYGCRHQNRSSVHLFVPHAAAAARRPAPPDRRPGRRLVGIALVSGLRPAVVLVGRRICLNCFIGISFYLAIFLIFPKSRKQYSHSMTRTLVGRGNWP